MIRKTGLAFDIGTTTIAAALVDLSSRGVLKADSRPNPQSRWGSDVVSRVEAVRSDPTLLKEMNASVINECGAMTEFLGAGDSSEITVAGNTVMEHIFFNVSPVSFAMAPYKPVFKDAKRVKALECGLRAAPGASLYLFPSIGSFVGGDAVAMILSLGLHRASGASLAIDIGTNSEIVLTKGGLIYATSAAAGPAFEGGGIRHGMCARAGAIDGVRIEGDSVALSVIGGVRPQGICGSGVIDAAASLLRNGLMERSGRILGKGEVRTNLSGRIREEKDGNAFVLYRGAGLEIVLAQSDVRALQAAKAAIKAGISVLLRKAGLGASEVGKVYLAGAFGSNLKAGGLTEIGILEESWEGLLEFSGDAALNGAVKALGDEGARREAEEIALKARYVPLSGSAHFEKEFIKDLDF